MDSVTASVEHSRSLRWRLTFSLAAGGGLLLGVLFLLLDVRLGVELAGRFDSALYSRARAVRALFDAGSPGGAPGERAWPEYSQRAHEDFYQVVTRDNRIVARSPSSRGGDIPLPPASPSAPTATGQFYDVRLPDGHHGRAVVLDLAPGPDGVTRRLIVASERESLDRVMRGLHAVLFAGALVALAVLTLIAVVVVRQGLRPLARFGDMIMRRVEDPAAPAPVPETLPTELTPIARTLNAAFDRLLEALARESRFGRDAAHELRTPLAEMELLTASLKTLSADPRVHDHAVAMLRSVRGMTSAVDGLLTLARCEAGLELPVSEPLDLVGIVRRQIEIWQPDITARGLDVRALLGDEHWVLGDAALVERIVSNLLGNAARHAPPHVAIDVLITDNGAPQIVIRNPAPHLTPALATRLGERGFNAGDSAARERHAGLGLALATALARTLGLRLTFTLEGGALVVQLGGFQTLPTLDVT